MTTNAVTIEREGALARTQFDQKGSLNAFDQDTTLALTEIAHGFQRGLSIHAVVLTGAPGVFSAGIDLKDWRMWQQEGISDLEKREGCYWRGLRPRWSSESHTHLPGLWTASGRRSPRLGSGR